MLYKYDSENYFLWKLQSNFITIQIKGIYFKYCFAYLKVPLGYKELIINVYDLIVLSLNFIPIFCEIFIFFANHCIININMIQFE